MTDKYRDLATGEQKYGKKIQMNIHTIPTPLSAYCPKNYWKYVLHGNCIDYILTEDYTALKKLLDKFPEFVNDCGYAKLSPLSMGSIRFFGTPIYEYNEKNDSPLGFVIMNGDDKSHVDRLLFDYIAVEKRANLYHVNDYGVNLLMLAITMRKVNYLDSLIKLDSSISKKSKSMHEMNRDPKKIFIPTNNFIFTLKHHTESKNYETLKYIVDNWDLLDLQLDGVNSVKDFINRKNQRQNDYTLLHEAVQMNQLNIARYLLEIGADVSACSENGNTPLHLAVEESNVLAVKLLLLYKADPNAVNKSGYDSFHKAPATFVDTFKSIVSNGVSAEEIEVALDDFPAIAVNAQEFF